MNIYASTIPHNAAKSCKPEEEQAATILDSLNKNCKGSFHKNQPRTLRVIVGEKIHLRRREKVKICSFDPGSCVSKIYWRPKSNVPLRDVCYASIFKQQNNTKLYKIFFIYLNLKNFRKRNVFCNGSHDSHAFRVAESDPCVMCKGFWDSRCC